MNNQSLWEKMMQLRLTDNLVSEKIKGMSKPETPYQKKQRLLAERKEKRRRARKITMTVGEYEDAIQKAIHDYGDW